MTDTLTDERLLTQSATPLRLYLQTTRTIEYTIYNSPRPILSVDEPIIARVLGDAPVYLVVDDSVMRAYGAEIMRYFQRHINLQCCRVISGAESAKTLNVVETLCGEAVAAGMSRRGVFVGIGGGVVLDVVGVAASLFRRGMPYVRIPTTLVGVIDVAVGIKHAVNFGGKKNSLGSFFPPLAGIVDRTFLRTLGLRHISCGFAEIIKMAMVRDADLFAQLEADGPLLLDSRFTAPSVLADHAIARAQTLMMEELQPNLYEDDLCRLVDFGHTFSSVFEASTGYALPHGEAVGLDMLLSTAIAVVSGVCQQRVLQRLTRLLASVRLPLWDVCCTERAMREAFKDARRHRAGQLNLVVPTRVGAATFMQTVPEDALDEALQLVRAASADVGR